MSNKRAKYTIINISVIVVMQILNLLYSLITKNLFLKEFSLSVYGVVDLFGSFFHSLMLLELGFGTILIYNLYKPLACDDVDEIRKQLSVFKSIYFYLTLVIVAISFVVAPFLFDIFSISYNDVVLVYEVYFANIFNIILKYWTLNKISIISASQEKYIENIAILFFDTIGFILRIFFVCYYKNLYLYIFAQLSLPSMAYIIETIWINRHYDVKDIKFASIKEIKNSGVLKQCKKYIYATIYSLVFVSMDNIIISSMLSTDAVAYVTNYNALLMTGAQFVIMIMMSLRGIMANYNHTEKSKEGFYGVFNIISSINYIVVALMVIGFYTLMDDFISLWLGDNYVIISEIFFVLLMIRMIESIFEPIQSVFVIKGYIFQEKYPLIISALINLFLTIILIKKIGFIGAYIATIIALIIKWASKIYYVLRYTFNSYKNEILRKYALYIVMIFIEMALISKISISIVPAVSTIPLFLAKFFIVIILFTIFNIPIIMLNKDTREYLLSMSNAIKIKLIK